MRRSRREMLAAAGAAAAGYALLSDMHVRREVLGALVDWMVQTLR